MFANASESEFKGVYSPGKSVQALWVSKKVKKLK
jgi:hypothetical protein